MAPILKSADELQVMREAGRIVAIAHEEMRRVIKPGVATKELDAIALTVLRDHGAEPCFLGYAPGNHPPFPSTITASINQELVHGIPCENRVLDEGDIIGIDVACFFQGFVGDAAFTHPVGEISRSAKRLLNATESALLAAIQASVVGNKISDVAKATAKCAGRHGYSVAREYTGHGVGSAMHEEPQVPNWWHSKRSKHQWEDYDLRVGMTYAIEPMLIAGRPDLIELDDGWTVVTKDGSLTAHFEHTIAITEGEPLILTLP
jgi:methionyl aminopeptidase